MGYRIALDAMGGDQGPGEIVHAALYSLKKHHDLEIQLVGESHKIQAILNTLDPERAAEAGEWARFRAAMSCVGRKMPWATVLPEPPRTRPQHDYVPAGIEVIHAPEVIEMDEAPSSALRNKKRSSMRVAIEQVKNGYADACVSSGNTGALMAISRYVLKMLPGIDRPAICTVFPGLRAHTHILDLGANVDSSAEQLFQFAVMGAELTGAVENIDSPRVALLNVGTEENKGNDAVKHAHTLFSGSHVNYIGFVEGNDIFSGDADVIVCDGFVGNIALKASEGVADFFFHHVTAEMHKNLYTRLAAAISMPVLKSIRRKTDPRRYNGASLLGLRGIVIKSHGSADRVSFSHAIEEAILEVEKNIPARITSRLEALLTGG